MNSDSTNTKIATSQATAKPDKNWFSAQMVVIVAVLFDFLGTVAGGSLSAFTYPGIQSGANWSAYAAFIGLGALIFFVTQVVSRCYAFSVLLTPYRKLAAMVGGWILTCTVLLAFIFLLKFGNELSRIWFVTWATSGLLFLIAWRLGYGELIRYLNQDGRFNKRGILVGGGNNAAHVISLIENSQEGG
ncbi:MAG: hypothetical protein M3O03_02880, partial [Pseudomonadota bacterium]|nr:hypothetical protein [Pseudomonadota bacterium]